MEDSFNTFDVTSGEKNKHVDDLIPVPEDDESSVQSSVPSLIKGADNYVRGLFNGFMNPSSDDDSTVVDEKKENDEKEEDEEEKEKPFLVSMRDAFRNIFSDKRALAILGLMFLIGVLLHMYKNGHLTKLAEKIPFKYYLTGEHDHHHEQGHSGCTCKHKHQHQPVVNGTGPVGECPCQRAKRLAEEAAKAAAAAAEAEATA
ncbi:hypothetical protein C922_04842 [Plasmodium inui San Antonio 1]|uniref:Uncharacterized protein n=1 Tax=Plasmodium inui San Antonio 1 TaxID=1237626 RepID=W6ZVJ9_9APIC|nr:hypothetical protein C922_04842 [Plasmodium inui San Antonio 1]EUD64802.1 hypothetical protein C922_04842 [Plasmodium inui San Antonio 1]